MAALVCAFAMGTFSVGSRGATIGDCTNLKKVFLWSTADVEGDARIEPIKYRINMKSFQEGYEANGRKGMTPEEVKQAIILAADTWSEQSNTLFFIYDGVSNLIAGAGNEDHPDFFNQDWTEIQCEESGTDYSLIYYQKGGGAILSPRCRREGVQSSDSKNAGTEFGIIVPV